ncbi:uncharacterized protein LOC120187737 [Hibiscus syriacus]|uniref:uncharacterized protein LOC120187737 n=1 Tax=Hibiscus syriacus TaxID=106335 RepID=UPI001924AED8|nr:uncharacterized protein LOC120187737 [Hibiscus syriacus]
MVEELHHRCHHHPLLFNDDTGGSSDATHDCAGCAEKVTGPSYGCEKCRFYLHKTCAESPSEIHHPAHRHRLLLPTYHHPKRGVSCDVCRKKVKGFNYYCSSCGFYLDFNCALLPRDTVGNLVETIHVAHPHPLISINPIRSFNCQGCRDPIEVDDASYACFDCRKFFHEKCLVPPTEINHPCHRKHKLLPVFNDFAEEFSKCSICEGYIGLGIFYRCAPCKFYMHYTCAWPPPIIEDKAHHDHPFTLLLKPNDTFDCNACGNQGNYVSYICSTCNIIVHKDCISLPRHIRLNLHPHPISHCFFLCVDRNDSRTWDCRICYKKVNIEHGSYYCSRPGCDFVIHVECSIKTRGLYGVVEVENPDEFKESDSLSEESTSSIIRVIKEIKVGDDVIAAEIEHVSHEHNLIFSDEIKDKKYCNGCVLPILSSFYYCSHCDFFLHKECAELRRMCRLWFNAKPFNLFIDGIFRCFHCQYMGSGFSYRVNAFWCFCLRCAVVPHSFTYQADEPHFLFFDHKYEMKCNACSEYVMSTFKYRCKDCTFALDSRCVTIPRVAWHKSDRHSLTLAYQDPDDYPLRRYCDICEEERDPQKWFYHCEICDNAMHIECVFGKYPFINGGSKYAYKGHPHPLAFVRKIYYYPECVRCREPCQDLALECVEQGCKYIAHWSCIKPS